MKKKKKVFESGDLIEDIDTKHLYLILSKDGTTYVYMSMLSNGFVGHYGFGYGFGEKRYRKV